MSARVPRRRSGIAHEVEGSGTVIYDRTGRRLLVLNDVGAAVWYLVDDQRTTEDIADEVSAVFPREASSVRADVEVFLESLEEAGVIGWT